MPSIARIVSAAVPNAHEDEIDRIRLAALERGQELVILHRQPADADRGAQRRGAILEEGRDDAALRPGEVVAQSAEKAEAVQQRKIRRLDRRVSLMK